MSKTISIGKRPTGRPSPEAIDKWLEGTATVAGEVAAAPSIAPPPSIEKAKTPAQKMKRLTIDIPDSLHRRLKSRCGQDGLQMADVVRDLIEQRFPE
jgi:hypothetical protein